VMLGCNFTVKVDRELMIEYVTVTHMCGSKNLKCNVFWPDWCWDVMSVFVWRN
jgi:hypothetical protein